MKVTSYLDEQTGNIFIFIDDTLHIHIEKSSYRGMNSFIDDDKKHKWQIEIFLSSATIELEYNTEEKWKQVLNELQKCLYEKSV